MGQRVEITAKERRRRWSDDEKRHLVAEAFAPGAIASYVARRYGVAESYPFAWRKRFSGSPNGAPPDGPRLIPVMVDPASALATLPPSDPAPIPLLSRHATITCRRPIRHRYRCCLVTPLSPGPMAFAWRCPPAIRPLR